jgi:hypothetical protein
MIINKDMVFIHLQKCGGTFIKQIMEQHLEATNVRPEHNGYSHIAIDNKLKPVLGSIRNPYSWYVSVYHSHLPTAEVSFFKDIFKKTNNFADWLKVLLNMDSGTLHDLQLETIAQMNIGPYTYRTLMCYGKAVRKIHNLSIDDIEFGKITYIKTENLARNFIKFLKENTGISQEIEDNILNTSSINKSSHGDYEQYYDKEAYELVNLKDNIVFEKFNYEHN